MRKKLFIAVLVASLLAVNMTAVTYAEPSSPTAASNQPEIILENSTQRVVDVINQDRGADQLVVYTTEYGQSTKPFGNDTVEFIITNNIVAAKNTNGQKGTYIPGNGYVLSGTGTALQFLQGLDVGQSVQLTNLTPPIRPSQYVTVNGITVPFDKFNGARWSGETVVYDPSYGPSTNTNIWGMEITVDNAVVTQVTTYKGNSPIPANGYVLSVMVDSPYYDKLLGKVAIGDAATLVDESPLYQANKIGYDGMNKAWRGSDQMIVYDSSYGGFTGTNPWGYEVTVGSDGKVVSVGGNNSPIPSGGMVLSGIGVKGDFLQKNAKIGTTVRLRPDKQEVVLLFTPDSYLDLAQISISKVENGLQESKNKFLDVPYNQIQKNLDSAKTMYDALKNRVATGDLTGLQDTVKTIDHAVSEAFYMNFETSKVENRGLWLRPLETNIEQVRNHVAQIYAANLNTIYLETWWDGYTIFPTDNKITRQNPIYQSFDVLQAYLDEAKKYNIEVHAWVENFFVGQELVEKKPEWSIRSRSGDNFESDPNGYKFYWINPALPQAQDFVAGIYSELIRKYGIDGLHLDFARYPDAKDYTNDFGYDEYTRGLFMNKYGVDPINLHPGDDKWAEWLQFKVDIINQFVHRIVSEAKAINPGIKISAAVWTEFESAPAQKSQDAKDWVDKNDIDHLLPMSYKLDVSSVMKDAGKAVEIAKDKAYVAIGLGTVTGLEKSVLAGQIDGTRQLGISGSAMFEFISFFANHYDKELKLGLFREKAVVPDRDPANSLLILFKDMLRKMNEIYIPNHGMTGGQQYGKEMGTALNMLRPGKLNYGKATALRVHLDTLAAYISNESTMHAEVKNRMLHDIHYGMKILDVYISKNASTKDNENG